LQFESTDARRCFPCWDEPALKARFAISLVASEDRTVHSNMPEVEGKGDKDVEVMAQGSATEGTRLAHFDLTHIMSTYLVAIVVGEFEAIESKTNENIKVII
jgi:puromycin-sensitive aminopeptidase